MSWYVLRFTAAQVAAGEVVRCKEAMEQSFAAARGPRTMALFQREGEEGGAELYFTPDCSQHAADLLADWQCTPCERPSLVGLQLLVGHSEITYYMP